MIVCIRSDMRTTATVDFYVSTVANTTRLGCNVPFTLFDAVEVQ